MVLVPKRQCRLDRSLPEIRQERRWHEAVLDRTAQHNPYRRLYPSDWGDARLWVAQWAHGLASEIGGSPRGTLSCFTLFGHLGFMRCMEVGIFD